MIKLWRSMIKGWGGWGLTPGCLSKSSYDLSLPGYLLLDDISVEGDGSGWAGLGRGYRDRGGREF